MRLSIFGLIALVLSLDLFLHHGEAATFDSPIHITNIAMYQQAIRDGDFPVAWADKFANYGLPTPIVSQQLTSYLGAYLTFLTKDPLIAYKLLVLLGAFLSCLTTYQFLKLYVKSDSALVGTILFNFTAYRISNIYIRGALPEFFAAIFVPLVLTGSFMIFHSKPKGLLTTIIGLTLLLLSHPFVFFVSLFLVIPYIVYLAFTTKKTVKKSLIYTALAGIVSIGLSAWYILPLVTEMKYFVISRNTSQLVNGQFMSLKNYLVSNWAYYSDSDIFVRANNIFFGLFETIVMVAGCIWLFISRRRHHSPLPFIFISAIILIFMTTSWSAPLYAHIPFLDGIQFPWRMFSALMFLPPLILAISLDYLPAKKWVGILVIIILVITRFPEIYGKNFTLYPPEHYTKTIKNLHFDSLNTIWIGNTGEYPIKLQKGDIIEGEGVIISRNEKNSWREYRVTANTDIRMIDYTFYFPGWTVYSDENPVEIEFQDMNYRGIITYKIPSGDHHVIVRFEDTKVRKLAKLVSLVSLVGCVTLGIALRIKNGRRQNT